MVTMVILSSLIFIACLGHYRKTLEYLRQARIIP